MALAETLRTLHVEKPWGRECLPAPFETPSGKVIGEIWFDPPADAHELLLKYIFTSDRLSVQVHPNDEQAEASGSGRKGKDECWYVLDAEPGAVLGVGFKEPVSSEQIRCAAEDGSIMDLLQWHTIRPGDFFHIPANTVHAIGAGVSIIEIQQNSDTTYRLYDYGRPRDLHLDDALAVVCGRPHAASLRRHVEDTGSLQLIDGPYFRLWRMDGSAPDDQLDICGRVFVLPYRGHAMIGSERVDTGQCVLVHDARDISFAPGSLGFVAQPV